MDTEQLRVNSRRGIIDIIRGGSPSLGTVRWSASLHCRGRGFQAPCQKTTGPSRLEELEAIYGDLPVEPIPGLDS
jgi:hypothetical protein